MSDAGLATAIQIWTACYRSTLLDLRGVVRRFAQSSISVYYFPLLGGSAAGLIVLVLIVVESQQVVGHSSGLIAHRILT